MSEQKEGKTNMLAHFERVKSLLDKALGMDPATDGLPIYGLIVQARAQISMAESHDTIVSGILSGGTK